VFLLLLMLAAPGSPETSTTLVPGALVDLARGTAYLGAPAGGVEAVQLESGSLLWSTEAASLPLALNDGALLAQGDEARSDPPLALVVLNTAEAGKTLFQMTTPVPRGVRARVTDSARGAFRVQARAVDRGFALNWTFRENPPHDMPPEGRNVAPSVSNGALLVDLKARRVEPLIADGSLRAGSDGLAPSAAVRARVEGGRGDALTLKRWNPHTRDALPDRVLLEKALLSLPSADERHLLAVERVGGGGPGDPEYRWSIFVLESGERVAELRRDSSAAPFVVWKDLMLVVSPPQAGERDGRWIEEPLSLLAIDAKSGAPRWRRALRDLEYRGAPSPMP